MPCEILVVAVPKIGLTEKGYPFIIKDTPCVWGNSEGLPNWVILKITDASKLQVQNYLRSTYSLFKHEIVSQNAQWYRIKVTVDPSVVSATGKYNALRAKIKDHIVNDWNGTIISHSPTEAVVDIPKPVDLVLVKKDIRDCFEIRILFRRYYFSSADVDTAIANGGFMELTKQQVLIRIIDKLDE